MPPPQRFNVVDSQLNIVWFEIHGVLEEEFSIVEHAKTHADSREQAHCLYMVWHFLQELATDILRLHQPALGDQIGDANERRRQILQTLELCPDRNRLLVETLFQKNLELASPACCQCGIESTGPRVGFQRIIGAAHVPVVMPLFLVGSAMLRKQRFQFGEVLQSLVVFVLVAMTDSGHVKRIAVFRCGYAQFGKIFQGIIKSLGYDFLLNRLQG